MGVLWSSIGAATAYEMFAGSAELLGGILLIIPRTALLGALVVVADMTQVFMLNMTYDVPVKGLMFHLLLMALFLAAPELRRLSGFFFLDSACRRLRSRRFQNAESQSHCSGRAGCVWRLSSGDQPLRRQRGVENVRRRRAEICALWHLGCECDDD